MSTSESENRWHACSYLLLLSSEQTLPINHLQSLLVESSREFIMFLSVLPQADAATNVEVGNKTYLSFLICFLLRTVQGIIEKHEYKA